MKVLEVQHCVDGYQFKTTFHQDFTIAERFGVNAIFETFDRVFKEYKTNIVYMTELAMVFNWKMWDYHNDGQKFVAFLYQSLYEGVCEYIQSHFEGDDLAYFYRETD